MTCRKSGAGVLALPAGGYSLVVDDFGEREAGRDKGECGLGFGVLRDVEARESAVVAGLERLAVGGGNLGERGGGGFVFARGVLLLAEGDERGGVGWRFGDGGFEALQALVGGGRGGAADVVLKRAEADAAGCSKEGLFGDCEMGIHALGDFPGDCVFDVEEAGEFGRVGEGRRHAELVDFKHLGLDFDAAGGGAGVGDVEAADDDVVRVQRLGDAEGGCAAGAEVVGEAEVFESEEAVVAADGEEAGGGEALVEGVGEGVADPVEVCLAGAVVEGEHQDEAAAGLADVRGRVGFPGVGRGVPVRSREAGCQPGPGVRGARPLRRSGSPGEDAGRWGWGKFSPR